MAKAQAGAIQISRKGLVVWSGLFLFVAAWMFVLGILVGRGVTPVDLDKNRLGQGLDELKSKLLQQEQAKADKQVADEGAKKPHLGFYEALKDPKGEKRYKPAPVSKPKPKPAPRPQSKPLAVVKKAPPKKPAADSVTNPAPKPAAASLKQTAAAAKGRFAIQVSAVRDAPRAVELVAKLRKKGYPAYQIRSVVADKGVWYRVRVGAYESRNEAGPTLEKLKADRYAGMIISTQ